MLSEPLRVAVVDDDDLVVHGLAAMLAAFGDSIEVLSQPTEGELSTFVDIALFDSFGHDDHDHRRLRELLASPQLGKIVVWTWNFQPWLAADTTQLGAAGYLSKSLPPQDLYDALLDVRAGKTVVSPTGSREQDAQWPGREHGLTGRESEVLTLIAAGHSNAEIAAMTHLSINSIKSYIRSCYRKIGATSRSQAVLWGVEHGLRVPQASPPQAPRTL